MNLRWFQWLVTKTSVIYGNYYLLLLLACLSHWIFKKSRPPFSNIFLSSNKDYFVIVVIPRAAMDSCNGAWPPPVDIWPHTVAKLLSQYWPPVSSLTLTDVEKENSVWQPTQRVVRNLMQVLVCVLSLQIVNGPEETYVHRQDVLLHSELQPVNVPVIVEV